MYVFFLPRWVSRLFYWSDGNLEGLRLLAHITDYHLVDTYLKEIIFKPGLRYRPSISVMCLRSRSLSRQTSTQTLRGLKVSLRTLTTRVSRGSLGGDRDSLDVHESIVNHPLCLLHPPRRETWSLVLPNRDPSAETHSTRQSC